MNKYVLGALILAVIALFIAGCAPQVIVEKEIPKEAEREREPVVTAKPAEEPPAVVETEPARQMSSKVEKLLQKHVGRLKSVSYMYQDEINYPTEWKTYVKGNLMHIELDDVKHVRGETYVDNVYLDLAKKEAVGYCERSVYRCADPNQPVDLNFDLYVRKHPLDWLDEIAYAEDVGSETKQQRTVIILEFEAKDGNTGKMWVDEYYGTPMDIEIYKGTAKEKIHYEDIAFNAVDDKDLTHGHVSFVYN